MPGTASGCEFMFVETPFHSEELPKTEMKAYNTRSAKQKQKTVSYRRGQSNELLI